MKWFTLSGTLTRPRNWCGCLPGALPDATAICFSNLPNPLQFFTSPNREIFSLNVSFGSKSLIPSFFFFIIFFLMFKNNQFLSHQISIWSKSSLMSLIKLNNKHWLINFLKKDLCYSFKLTYNCSCSFQTGSRVLGFMGVLSSFCRLLEIQTEQ